MTTQFSFAVPPFDALSAAERAKLSAALDIAFYPSASVLMRSGDAPEHLFVVVKGIVQALDAPDAGGGGAGEVVNVYGEHDAFDALALLDGGCRNALLRVEEDLVCHLLPKQVFLELARTNPRFAGFFTESLAERLSRQIHRETDREMAAGFLAATVADATVTPPVFAAPETSLRDAARMLGRAQAHTLLVRGQGGEGGAADAGRVGLATRSSLGAAVLLRGKGPGDPVGGVARYDLVTIRADQPLSDAMEQMTRHGVRRLVVTGPGRDGGDDVVGVLELVSLLGYLANQSHLVSTQIRRARSVGDLKAASDAIGRLVHTMAGNGTKQRVICAQVTTLNRALLRRLFDLVVLPDIAAGDACCLVVMGSEGRGEQTIRTDQDNAMVLRDGADVAAARAAASRFSAALAEIGFPPCPGGMMVSNPAWTRTVSDFRAQIHCWLSLSTEDAFLPLAALTDAAVVAGDPSLLAEVRDEFMRRVRGNDAFLARFARPVLSFDTPGSGPLASILHAIGDSSEGIDLKKAGLFPVVHGVRSFALERGIAAIGTDERIERLAGDGLFGDSFAADLREAFLFLLALQLKTALAAADRGNGGGAAAAPLVDRHALSRAEATLLKDSLRVVVALKEQVAHHFRLSLF